jgi:GT2 family glycosyltransferase
MNTRRNAVSVVIVNYNGENLLPDCLNAVYGQTHVPTEIIVVDNASPDKSVEVIRRDHHRVTLLAEPENLFFAAGANRGIAAASGEFILLLNNDCMLDPQYIEMALIPMLERDDIGAVTGRIMRIDGATFDAAGQVISRSRKPLDRGYGQADNGQFSEPEEVHSAGGVAPLIRRAMLDDIAVEGQWFDEAFVQYYEDLDLFWRARNLGWRSWYTPAATARHYRGATGQSGRAVQGWVRSFAFANLPPELQVHVLKNRYAVMAKNDRLGSWLLNLPWILAYEFKIFAYILMVRPSLFPRYFKGFGFLKHAFAQRRILKGMAREKGIDRYGGPRGGVQQER